MKKIMALLSLSLAGCACCHPGIALKAKVLEVYEDRLLVEASNDELYYDQIYLLLSEYTNYIDLTKDQIQVNDELEIIIDDKIMMSLPAQVNVLEIKYHKLLFFISYRKT